MSPTVWEIKLRKDVKFHDGSPLTAEDVKYTIERILTKDLASPHYSQLTSISEVRVKDSHTLEIETKKPDPVLMRRMQPIGGSGRVFIVSKAHFEKHKPEDLSQLPMGTGPYKLGSWRKGAVCNPSPPRGLLGNGARCWSRNFYFHPRELDTCERLATGRG